MEAVDGDPYARFVATSSLMNYVVRTFVSSIVVKKGDTYGKSKVAITDGKFEFIAIKGKPLIEMTPVLMKMLTGEHIHDKNVLYLRDHYFKIECLDPDFKIMESTVDGELGPDMPFEIKVIPKAIPVFGKFEKEPKENIIMSLLKSPAKSAKL